MPHLCDAAHWNLRARGVAERAIADHGGRYCELAWRATYEDRLGLGTVTVHTLAHGDQRSVGDVVLVQSTSCGGRRTTPLVGRVECEHCEMMLAFAIREEAMTLWRKIERQLGMDERRRLGITLDDGVDQAGADLATDGQPTFNARRWWKQRAEEWKRATPDRIPWLVWPTVGSVTISKSVVERTGPHRLVVAGPLGLTVDEAVEIAAHELAASLRSADLEEQGAAVERMQRETAIARDQLLETRAQDRDRRAKASQRGRAAIEADGPWARLGPHRVAAFLRLPAFAIAALNTSRGRPSRPEQRVADRALELLGWPARDRRVHVLADVVTAKAIPRRKRAARGKAIDRGQHRRLSRRR